jgi:hypothetical protein
MLWIFGGLKSVWVFMFVFLIRCFEFFCGWYLSSALVSFSVSKIYIGLRYCFE